MTTARDGGAHLQQEIAMRLALLALLVTTPLIGQDPPSPSAERSAFRWSLWGTLIPVVAGTTLWMAQSRSQTSAGPDRSGAASVMAVGFIFGPSLGYHAAGLGGRGMRGVRIRAGLTMLSFLPAMAICGWDCSKGDDDYELAWVLIATGGGLAAASAVYDIVQVRDNVRQHRARSRTGLSVTPIYLPGQHQIGVRGAFTF